MLKRSSSLYDRVSKAPAMHALVATLISTIWLAASGTASAAELAWMSTNRCRILLQADPLRPNRSNSPASVQVNFNRTLADLGVAGSFDENSIEVIAHDSSGKPRVYDGSHLDHEGRLLPWRLDGLFGTENATLNFAMPDHTCTEYAVYFDTAESGRGKPQRYPGLIGDGDFFREEYKRREINACKFDSFCDFDGDGDLDLFKAGVEPFIYCYENVGGNRLAYRGLLSSGGKGLALPHENVGSRRAWMAVAFDDWDEDGDQDLFVRMGDGPQAGKVLAYENAGAASGELTFVNRGSLISKDGQGLPGRFAAITFVDYDGDAKKDVVVAAGKEPKFFRNVGLRQSLQDIQLAQGVPIHAKGGQFEFVVSKTDFADMDNDGDLDLFAADGRGPIYLFMNTGTRTAPEYVEGSIVAYQEPFMIGDAHTGVKAGDFDGDGLVDLVGGRYWERTPLSQAAEPRYYGGLFRNVGTAGEPRFERSDAVHGSPHTERFQICDAVRQNVVRAVDWNNDGKLDLIAGDTDGFVWYFRNRTNNLFPGFATGEKLKAGGEILSRFKQRGHARPEITDWNNDGKKDLVLADSSGQVILYLNTGTDDHPVLGPGEPVEADGKPIRSKKGRASVTVADWDNDGKKDLVYADQDKNKGYQFFRNVGTDAKPVFAAAEIIRFRGEHARYVRANLGKCVDWDGDGKRDFIGCEYEHNVRFYRNVGYRPEGSGPRFDSRKGTVILRSYTWQMISGADVIDWNGDGDLDILTGQGHGGSGLRFYERDYIEDRLNDTYPVIRIEGAQKKPT